MAAIPASPNGQPPSSPRPLHASDELDPWAMWTIVRHGWLPLAGCVLAALLLGWAVTFLVPPTYRASTTLRIEDENEGLPLQGLATRLVGAQDVTMATEMEVLQSRTLAAQVIDSLDLRLRLEGLGGVPRRAVIVDADIHDDAEEAVYELAPQGRGTWAVRRAEDGQSLGVARAGVPAELPGLVLRLAPTLPETKPFKVEVVGWDRAFEAFGHALAVTRPNHEAAVVEVTYEGSDPEIVRDVPNLLAQRFLANRLLSRKTGARSTVAFLRTQVDTLAVQLRRAEDSLRAFREREGVLSPSAQAETQIKQLIELKAQRDAVDAERTALEEVMRQVDASPSGGASWRQLLAFPSLIRNVAASTLLEQLTTLETQRATLLQRRTPKDPEVASLDRMIADQETKTRAIVTTYLEGLRAQVAAMDSTLRASGEQLERIPANEVAFARLQRNTTVLTEIFTLLQTKLKESEIAQAVEDPSAQIIDPAELPGRPVRPVLWVNLAAALAAGLAVGLAAIFGRAWLDRAIHTGEELQLATGLPVLGSIPRIGQRRGGLGGTLRDRWRRPASAPAWATTPLLGAEVADGYVAEAYRALRTSLAFARPGQRLKHVVVTSPAPGDGKSTSMANLAASLAQQGNRVLLIDADMRRGVQHQLFGGVRDPGLADVLLGTVPPRVAVQTKELAGGHRVDFLSSGPVPPNPAELLGAGRLERLLGEVADDYDFVLIDAPPVNLFTDAAVIASAADGVVLVARAGRTEWGALNLALTQLGAVHAPVVGVVLNGVDARRDAKYSGHYSYYYHSEDRRHADEPSVS